MQSRKTAEIDFDTIDFDTWSELAKTDPDAFEAMRLAAIDAAIGDAPEANRERLRRLQWRIDQERRLAHTPMAACMRISRMMWRSVLGPNGLHERLTELQHLVSGVPQAPSRQQQATRAEVVAFARAGD